ncbi:MAG: YHS domain-containing protein, partial [Planctomycetota bacterium]
MAKDPICGMTVDAASALHAERDGQTYYFCSDHCRQTFLSKSADTKRDAHSATTKHKPQAQGAAIYTCPMHPEVQQDHPGD